MNIQINGTEMSRMMKTILQCTDNKTQSKLSNICITHEENLLKIRSANGQFMAEMATPLLGGDGESFCVDGSMFAKVCGLCKGNISISTNEKDCVIKGSGRTRLPIVNVKIPAVEKVKGESIFVKGEHIAAAYFGIEHAIGEDQSRVTLTGIHAECLPEGLKMTALDGFRMAQETVDCDGDAMDIIIPGGFMKLVVSSIGPDDTIHVTSDGKRIQVETDGMILTASLLTGQFPPVERLIPEAFKTELMVNSDDLKDALRASSVINNSNKTVRFYVEDDKLRVTNNCEQADYEAEIGCSVQGEKIMVAFNQEYITDAIRSVDDDDVIIKLNTKVSPVMITRKNASGFRILSPVRTGVGG